MTTRRVLDENGHELPDPVPLVMPAGFKRPETLAEQVQRLVRGSLSRQAQEAGFESFEESEDFELPDDPDDPTTPYEEYFDPVLGRGITAQEFRDNFEVYKRRFLEADARAYAELERSDALRRPIRSRSQDDAGESRAASERVSPSSRGKAKKGSNVAQDEEA